GSKGISNGLALASSAFPKPTSEDWILQVNSSIGAPIETAVITLIKAENQPIVIVAGSSFRLTLFSMSSIRAFQG
ncbi:MAG TPA: hypothetical protein DCP31_16005, partial [Cyanobacteria bacterium UBA8543]|nr:hypothetical protein [Cyanobacteria bacterium UBA8543]